MPTIPTDRVRIDAYIPRPLNDALRDYIVIMGGAKYRGALSIVIAQALSEFLEKRGFKVELQPKMEIKKVGEG